jgi:hypothetical protein
VRFTRPGSPSAQQIAIRRARTKANAKKKFIETANGERIEVVKPKRKKKGEVSALRPKAGA